jgi:transposase
MGNMKGVKRDFRALERRRMKASRLFEAGLSQSEVARRLKVSRQTTHRWHEAWRGSGAKALRAAGRAGRKPRLSVKQAAAVTTALVAGPRANRFGSDVWTLRRVLELVEKLTGVKYHIAYMGRLMRALGWSCQRPAARAKERDEKKIQAWRQATWQRIKKKPENRNE